SERRRARLAVLVLAVPPLIDIACRVAGLQPALAAPRTELTLACCPTLSLLLALRRRHAARPPPAPPASPSTGPRPRLAEPSAALRSDARLMLPAALSVVLRLRASREGGRARWFWRLLALGPALWLVAEALWMVAEYLGRAPRLPSDKDAGLTIATDFFFIS